MPDAATRHHQAEIAGLNRLQTAEQIPMQDSTPKEVGSSGDIDIRVRTHVDTLALRKCRLNPYHKRE